MERISKKFRVNRHFSRILAVKVLGELVSMVDKFV